MTYGLEMDIRRMLPDPETAVQLVQSDPYTQDYLVRRVLTPKKAMISNIDELVTMEDANITTDEVEAVLMWVTEHSLYFFIKRALAMQALGVQYQAVLPKPSPAGSEDSPSTTPTAGPSE